MENIQAMLFRFLQAFSRLQLDEMMEFFVDDATAFFPIKHQYFLQVGKEAISDSFASVIARIRSSGATRIRLDPHEVRVKVFDDIAVVTFYICDEELNRRTLVLRRVEAGWHIEHLHGSNAPLSTNQTVT